MVRACTPLRIIGYAGGIELPVGASFLYPDYILKVLLPDNGVALAGQAHTRLQAHVLHRCAGALSMLSRWPVSRSLSGEFAERIFFDCVQSPVFEDEGTSVLLPARDVAGTRLVFRPGPFAIPPANHAYGWNPVVNTTFPVV